jgi:DNA replication licensing factor MCM5
MSDATGSIFYSYQNREGHNSASNAPSSARTSSLTPVEVRRRFKAFLLGFANARFLYVYRDRLRAAANAGVHALTVDLADLAHFDPDLAASLRDVPGDAIPHVEKAAAEAAAVLQSNPGLEDDQVAVNGQDAAAAAAQSAAALSQSSNAADMTSGAASKDMFPSTFQILLRSAEVGREVRLLDSADVSHLICVSGIVIGASKVLCKSTLVCLKCRNCADKISVQVNPGLGGFAAPRQCRRPPAEGETPCPLDPYVPLPDEGRYVDSQTLKLQELPEAVPTGEMPRSISLSCDRYLTDNVSPGVRVSVIGIFSVGAAANASANRRAPTSGSSLAVSVRAPYVRVLGLEIREGAGFSGGRTSHSFGFDEEEAMLRISRTPDLYKVISRSIAPEIFGHGDIKRAIAAQLFGGAADKSLPDGMRLRGDLNVLLLGDPSTAKSQMLKFAERVAPISVYTSGKGSSAAGLTASLVKDKAHGEFHLEGGAMVLADGGIVCIDEFDKMRLQDRVAIHEAMEQQTISIAKAGITAVLNARSAVLAAANPAFGRYDDNRSSAENIEFQSTILSRFDLIFIVRDVRDDARDRKIAEHVLSLHQRGSASIQGKQNRGTGFGLGGGQGNGVGGDGDGDIARAMTHGVTGSGDKSHLDINSLKRYIAYARGRSSPRLSEEAGELLRNNYVSIREQMRAKAFGDEDVEEKTVPITVRQLEAIVRISEALAKMTLCELVTETHVTEALRIFKVATLDSARTGAVSAPEGALRPEVRMEVQRVEEALKRRLAIGSQASERRLMDHFLDENYSEFAIRHAIMIMVRRGELQYRRQRKVVYRAQ